MPFDLEKETETIRNYRDRVPESDALAEYVIAEHIREIQIKVQGRQIDLATALDIDMPNPKGDS